MLSEANIWEREHVRYADSDDVTTDVNYERESARAFGKRYPIARVGVRAPHQRFMERGTLLSLETGSARYRKLRCYFWIIRAKLRNLMEAKPSLLPTAAAGPISSPTRSNLRLSPEVLRARAKSLPPTGGS